VTHYHVVAIHDWGGSQQCDHVWDDHWTQDQAKGFADHVIKADSSWDVDLSTPAFSYDYFELKSCNVAPGYNAVWIVACESTGRDCRNELFDRSRPRDTPYWEETTLPREAKRHPRLRLIGGAE
jgi:hypothetical protein